jgi:hypothetical protein
MHKSTRFLAAALLLAPLAAAGPQARQDANADDWCREQSWDDRRQAVCEVRQFTVPATAAVLGVVGTNGGIRVEGQARSDVQILARVVATAGTEARAREIASAIQLNPTLDRVEADGPRNLQNREGWHVSYRLYVPRHLNMALRTTNGGISIQDVESEVQFQTTNGGVKLLNVGGKMQGRTTNGGVDVSLEGSSWNGDGLDVETTNGGVRLSIPEGYSANLETRTQNGGFNTDFPGLTAPRRERQLSAQLGAGGAPIRVRTTNGGVKIARR